MSGISTNIKELLASAEERSPSDDQFLHNLFANEVKARDEKQLLLKTKLARLPLNHHLDGYDCNFTSDYLKHYSINLEN